MKRMVIGLFLVLLTAVPAWATSIVWSPASVSDDNGGLFLLGATTSAFGTTFALDLPSYSTTSQFGFPPNEVDLGVSASVSGGVITGVTFRYFGLFTDQAFAVFSQIANLAPLATGTFSAPSFTGFIPVAPTSLLNLTTQLNLFDEGDSAAVRRIQFDVVATPVPEPGTMVLLGTGLAALVGRMRVRPRRRTRE